jgi:hypothetical protein
MFYSNTIFPADRIFKAALFLAFALGFSSATALLSSAEDGDKAATPPAAESDGYFEDTPNVALKDTLPKIKPSIQSGKFDSPAAKQLLEDYFANYEFKLWTQKKNVTKIIAMRKEFKTNCIRAKTGPVHDRLNELALDELGKKLKNKKYRPIFLANAMLTIGDLNAVEGSTPTPLPQALPVLLENLNDAQQLDVVKVEALVGIRRHVVSGVKDPTIAAAMLKLAAVDDSDAGKAWMRSQAVEILGYLQSPGNGNQVVKLLLSIITDEKASLKLRYTAAEALGQLNLSAAAGLKADDLIAALTKLMKDGCNAELKNVKENNESVSPRKMKTCLDAVTTGFGDSAKGVASLKDAAAVKKIDDLKKFFTKELLAKLDSEDSSDEDLEKAVDATLKKLELL